MTTHPSKLRILCLHGWMQNAEVMSRNMAAMTQRFNDSIEFDIPTGPVELPTALKPGRPTNTPLAAWMVPQMDDDGNLVDLDGFADTVQFLVEYIQKNGPFDGVLGFSQGAGLAVLLLLVLSQDDWRNRYNIPSDVPQFRLAVILSGFRFQTPKFAEFYTRGKLDVPTMHVYSAQDAIISVDRSLDLIDSTFTDAVKCTHDLGYD
ncbi:hypothetical protein NQZ79_g1624 [Umbelopsis isabellina]|nr:hypothetical protein NQZ79_g1624 [Umbelopsis isabellina]